MSTPQADTELSGDPGEPETPLEVDPNVGTEPDQEPESEPEPVPEPEPEPPTRAEREASLLTKLVLAVEGSRGWGWAITLAITGLAALLRLVGLDRPARLVFDETYYVKQAYSLLTLGYESQWQDDIDDAFAAGDFSGIKTDGAYVVHPPLGKWLIALGMKVLGPESITGWRIAGAIAGIIGVLLVTRIGRRLLGSTLLGATAGLFLAVDGMHIVLSRTGILDIFVSTFVLAAFGTLLLDRDATRRRLAARVAAELDEHGTLRDPWGPRLGIRWWLVATGVLLGLACGVKWSGIYAVAVFGVIAVAWSIGARKTAGVKLWFGAGAVRDGVVSFFAMVPIAVVTYVACWTSWFLSPKAYNRMWAVEVNAVADVPQRPWLPDALNSFWEYHLQIWNFHRGLDSEHTYSSHPAGWLLQLRPTSFAWGDVDTPPGGNGRWVEAVLAVGNPIVWWAGAAALVVVIWWALRFRDWRAWGVLAGYLAMYVPWFTYSPPFSNRTIFTFYTVAFAPFVALALAFGLGVLIGRIRPLVPLGTGRGEVQSGWLPFSELARSEQRLRRGVAVGVVVAALVVAAFFWPIWSGEPIPYTYWHAHMWVNNFKTLRIGWV